MHCQTDCPRVKILNYETGESLHPHSAPHRPSQGVQPLHSHHKSQPAVQFQGQEDLLLLLPCCHPHSHHNKVMEVMLQKATRGNCKYFRLKVRKINAGVAVTTDKNNISDVH